MAFSHEWDELYAKSKHMSVWPWSDLVSYVMRYAKPKMEGYSVLELGCGAGANIPIFYNYGGYYAVEGSSVIVKALKNKYALYRDNIVQGDFTKDIPFDLEFDLIFDRGAVYANPEQDIVHCIEMCKQALKPGGVYIGIDWYSTSHSGYYSGHSGADPNTKICDTGIFENTGNVHFATLDFILEIFSGMKPLAIEEKMIKDCLSKDQFQQSMFNFAFKKS